MTIADAMKHARWSRHSTVWGRRYVLVAPDGQWLASIVNPWFADGIGVGSWGWTVLIGVPWQGAAPLLWRAKAAAEQMLARVGERPLPPPI